MASGEIEKNMLCEYLDVYIMKSNHLSGNLNDHTEGIFKKQLTTPHFRLITTHKYGDTIGGKAWSWFIYFMSKIKIHHHQTKILIRIIFLSRQNLMKSDCLWVVIVSQQTAWLSCPGLHSWEFTFIFPAGILWKQHFLSVLQKQLNIHCVKALRNELSYINYIHCYFLQPEG